MQSCNKNNSVCLGTQFALRDGVIGTLNDSLRASCLTLQINMNELQVTQIGVLQNLCTVLFLAKPVSLIAQEMQYNKGL